MVARSGDEKSCRQAAAYELVMHQDVLDSVRDDTDQSLESTGWQWFCRRSGLCQAALITAALATAYLIFILICAAAIFTGKGY